MKRLGLMPVIIVLAALLIFQVPAFGSEEWETRPLPLDVENGVICVIDGCMMNLSACETPAAQKLRGIIREKMYKDGWDKEQTYAYLAEVYGDKVLAAPPKRGFNWVIWLGPLAATVTGGAFLYLGLEKWVGSSQQEKEADPLDPEDAHRLDEELKKYL
ncbi:uncharacterized protein involved in biosynthesis of c-type cytochromes [Desulfosporosinus orientis DSM 765]|uniref:Cytochrome c-type biogenesis protein n=1 Tax=Desulfosporosinus orientis (strain ATCC 19365 / DSM 765 / NCIMB 8382 / VKM B-1628 / Singapore I) TaxID=768706 RepID=G7WCC4_DESOD|nr:cytochrome c-type biogenesis protein CcmH [Desulfosporosinus orientis]AET66246.1 uncharacterized protein involved in biosynthesis of c-type cytochromes [Desulfosporosinus orientis DSM 765]